MTSELDDIERSLETGFETPSGFRRKADELRASYGRLVESYPDDGQIKSVAREFDDWHYRATKEGSPLSQMFGSDELDKWYRRYSEDYSRLTGQYPSIKNVAPAPQSLSKPSEGNWLWYGGGLLIAAGIGWFLARR